MVLFSKVLGQVPQVMSCLAAHHELCMALSTPMHTGGCFSDSRFISCYAQNTKSTSSVHAQQHLCHCRPVAHTATASVTGSARDDQLSEVVSHHEQLITTLSEKVLSLEDQLERLQAGEQVAPKYVNQYLQGCSLQPAMMISSALQPDLVSRVHEPSTKRLPAISYCISLGCLQYAAALQSSTHSPSFLLGKQLSLIIVMEPLILLQMCCQQ